MDDLLKQEGLRVAEVKEKQGTGVCQKMRDLIWGREAQQEEEGDRKERLQQMMERMFSNEMVVMRVEGHDEETQIKDRERVEQMVRDMNLVSPQERSGNERIRLGGPSWTQHLTFRSTSHSFSLASTLLSSSSGKVVFHPGHLKVIKDAQSAEHPLVFVTFNGSTRRGAHLAWAILKEKADIGQVSCNRSTLQT